MASGDQPTLKEFDKPGSGYEWLEPRGSYFANLICENAQMVEMQEQGDQRDLAFMNGDATE